MFAGPGEAGTGGEVDHESSRSSVVFPLLLLKQGAAVNHSVKIYLPKSVKLFLRNSEDDVVSEICYLHAEVKTQCWRDSGVVYENVDIFLEKLFRRCPDLLPLSPLSHIVLLKCAGILSKPLGRGRDV